MISTTRILVLTLGVAGLSANRFSREASVAAFRFSLAPVASKHANETLWRATATFAPPGVRPAVFDIRLASAHHEALKPGAVVNGAFLRVESITGILPWYALSDAFPPGGSGGMSLVPTDSVPFAATVRQTSPVGFPWTVEIQLQNTARCLMLLDGKAQKGELRPIAGEYNSQILSALVSLGVPRQR
jgi:hypothetical protein